MKLKNILLFAFLILTLIPTVIVSLLLYKSGYNLSKESYMRNLNESINVQSDYISQNIENNMVYDNRFAKKLISVFESDESLADKKSNMHNEFQTYLESSEDKIAVSILIDNQNEPIYTIGEEKIVDLVRTQLPELLNNKSQSVAEFDLGDENYSLGVITPIFDKNNNIYGNFVSVYDKSYIFKTISSYYKISNTSTYLCRENGEPVNSKEFLGKEENQTIYNILKTTDFNKEGAVDLKNGSTHVSGYYKNIHNSQWYLIGFINDDLVNSFVNQFIVIYILIIVAILIADIMLSFYFSRRVVAPINGLIQVMEDYQTNLGSRRQIKSDEKGYFETKYLQEKFFSLMKTIMLVQHNFEGVYQLYQSNDMGDINIDIDVKNQNIHSNKESFEKLFNDVEVREGACVVEHFTKCFCEKDSNMLMKMFEGMRDKHLSVTCETEVHTPYLDKKWFHALVVPMYEGERLSRLFIQLRDISEFKKQEIKSNEQVRRDSITGLYNRVGFTDYVENYLESDSNKGQHGLFFIDMNYFKLVNDNFGHGEGDRLLKKIGSDLSDAVGENNITSRFGGDEFAVFAANVTDEEFDEIKQNINRSLVYPYFAEESTFVVSASVGSFMWDNAQEYSLDEILQNADASMYRNKRRFKESIEK